MLLAQYNPIKFYENKKARQYEKTKQNIESIVFYPIGQIPMVQLVVDSIYVSGQYVWQLELYDEFDNKITLPSSLYMSWYAGQNFVPGSGIYNIYYAGTDLNSMSAGYYYLKLTNGINSAYSDVFAWTDDKLPELLKLTVQTANLGNQQSALHTLGLTNTFYLNATYLGIKPKIDQTGVDNNAITDIIFGSRAITREFEIDANESIFIYLSALGMVKSNGTIGVEWEYESFTASDILVEESTNHNGGLYQIKFSFVDESETISVNNE